MMKAFNRMRMQKLTAAFLTWRDTAADMKMQVLHRELGLGHDS